MMQRFNLKKIWFDKIKSGEKTHEYRVCSRFWNVRMQKLINKSNQDIVFVLGYPPSANKDKLIYARVKRITVVNGLETDLKVDRDVYDIEFEVSS